MHTTSFPEAWFGTWSGEVEKISTSGGVARFGFDLTIGPTDALDRFTWSIRYRLPNGLEGEATAVLLVRDETTGHYALDEGEGIEVEARLMGDTFTIWSTRMSGPGGHSLDVFRLRDLGTEQERIEYERYGTGRSPDATTVSTMPDHELEGAGLVSIHWRPLEVRSWLVQVRRQATLRRE